jgi:hypothetical protein
MILYYLNKDILLDVEGYIDNISYNIVTLTISLNYEEDIFDLNNLYSSKKGDLGDIFILDGETRFSQKLIRCTCLGFLVKDGYHEIRITCDLHIFGEFIELERIYRDMKIDLIL